MSAVRSPRCTPFVVRRKFAPNSTWSALSATLGAAGDRRLLGVAARAGRERGDGERRDRGRDFSHDPRAQEVVQVHDADESFVVVDAPASP